MIFQVRSSPLYWIAQLAPTGGISGSLFDDRGSTSYREGGGISHVPLACVASISKRDGSRRWEREYVARWGCSWSRDKPSASRWLILKLLGVCHQIVPNIRLQIVQTHDTDLSSSKQKLSKLSHSGGTATFLPNPKYHISVIPSELMREASEFCYRTRGCAIDQLMKIDRRPMDTEAESKRDLRYSQFWKASFSIQLWMRLLRRESNQQSIAIRAASLCVLFNSP
jgi:hypothetical protein